ncbi:type II toxin-antitoxin system HipA family toxin [Thioclava kandeliae]|uniref:Type II toxin-antitoxin system HipA family toxin n=1 Tax=Thioclava kandeliae TaxID=3070818 RepID=A0ABV1SHJ7_9RHOB
MGRKRHFVPLDVYLNGRQVGQLARAASGAVYFAYGRDWLDWEHSFPVSLSLPLREGRYSGAVVLAVFDNLLPDYEPIRRRVAERVGAQGADTYGLLSAIGRDCVGALQFLPEGEAPQALDRLSGTVLDEAQIAARLRDLDLAPLGLRAESGFRISIAGAQEKTALLYQNGQWIEPDGTTPTTHILKPQIGRLPNGMDLSDSVENEHLCLTLLEAFGLSVAQTRIARFEDQKVLVVERFDRRWARDGRLLRLPQEDMCQALSIPPSRKYQNEGGPGIAEIMALLRGSDQPLQDRLDFFRANVLFWLMGATDGHAKNFSLALAPGGRFRMTPLYDVLSVQPGVDTRQIQRKEFRLAMRWGGSNNYRVQDIVGRHIIETGLASGLSREMIASLCEELRDRAEGAIARSYGALPEEVPERILDSIASAMTARLQQLV